MRAFIKTFSCILLLPWCVYAQVAGDPIATEAIDATLIDASEIDAIADPEEEQVFSQLGNIRGLIKPKNEATLSSEIPAKITKLPFKEGQRFNKGDTLVRFDCSRYNAELAAARAEQTAYQKTYENNLELERLNAIGKLEVEVSSAEAQKAAADVKVRKVIVNGCTIRAPFSGRVVERMVNQYEAVSVDQELMTIMDEGSLEIELLVPSKWLTWLKKGTQFSFHIDETGQEHPAKVSELGARVDPVSQTIRVDGVFGSQSESVFAGMSGTAKFVIPE